MKQSVAILLLGVLLLNWGGYTLLTDYFDARAESRLQAKLDCNQYNEADLVKIKVAAFLPYMSSSEQFERASGSIEIAGVTYNYVKRRFYRDTLELYCILNIDKAKIKNSRDDFSRLANDFVAQSNSSNRQSRDGHSAKFSLSFYTGDHSFGWEINLYGIPGDARDYFLAYFKSAHPSPLEKPPRLV